MLAQAAGFALLAAISPTALIVMAVFLGSANPRLTALAYVIGAFVMTVAMAVVVLTVLRSTGLNQPREHDPRYEFRLALGVLALASAAFLARRKRKRPAADPAQPRQGLMYRLTSSPSPRTAFAAGVLIFAPSTTFIAAVQVIATAEAAVPVTAVALVLVIVLTCLVVWLPLLAYLAAPQATTRWLKSVNDWLRTRGRALAVGALTVCGVVLVINGALGVAHVL